MLQEFRFRHSIQHDIRRSACQRIAAKRRAMIAGPECPGHFIRSQERADGYAAGKPLCQGNDIRLHPILLIGKEFAAAADARLNFIKNEQRMILVTKRPHLLQISRVRGIHTALSLNRLQHNCCSLIAHHRCQLSGIIIMNIIKSSRQRPYSFMIMRLSGCRKRSNRTAMKAVPGSDDLRLIRVNLMRILAGDFYRSLVGFGS